MKDFFKTNLKYLREKEGLEQMELASMLGFKSSSAISEWEKGVRIPNIGVLSDIASIFNITLSELVEIDLTEEQNNIKPQTIAAHLPDGVKLTEEEEKDIRNYVSFILSQRNK